MKRILDVIKMFGHHLYVYQTFRNKFLKSAIEEANNGAPVAALSPTSPDACPFCDTSFAPGTATRL